MHKVFKILIVVAAVIALGIVGIKYALGHEPDGDCHLPYNEPTTEEDRCRHACDHKLCECDKECKKKCKDDEECYHKCGLGPCLQKHGKCNQKCES